MRRCGLGEHIRKYIIHTDLCKLQPHPPLSLPCSFMSSFHLSAGDLKCVFTSTSVLTNSSLLALHCKQIVAGLLSPQMAVKCHSSAVLTLLLCLKNVTFTVTIYVAQRLSGAALPKRNSPSKRHFLTA